MSRKEQRAALIARAEQLLQKKPYTQEDNALFNSLMRLSDAMAIEGESSTTPDEKRSQKEFRDYLLGVEQRAALTEPNTGMLVPPSFYRTLLTGVAQYTELMDKNNVNLIESEKALPLRLPEIDLSTISCSIVGQAVDAPPVINPTIASATLKGFSYRCNPLASSFELEQDSFESITDIFTQAFSVGLARGIGSDLCNGAGAGVAPQGILTAAANSGVVSTTSGVWDGISLAAVYGSLNRAYRASPKCAWLMNDITYQQILALKDANGRPLLGVREDEERLFGKRVLISPDMPTGPSAKSVLIADMSQFYVRVVKAGMMVRRNTEAPGYAEAGAALYTAYLMVDSALNTAGGGVKPAVYGTAHV